MLVYLPIFVRHKLVKNVHNTKVHHCISCIEVFDVSCFVILYLLSRNFELTESRMKNPMIKQYDQVFLLISHSILVTLHNDCMIIDQSDITWSR